MAYSSMKMAIKTNKQENLHYEHFFIVHYHLFLLNYKCTVLVHKKQVQKSVLHWNDLHQMLNFFHTIFFLLLAVPTTILYV